MFLSQNTWHLSHTLHRSSDNWSISLLKFLASKGEHSLASEFTGGKYHGMHLSFSLNNESTWLMWHSCIQDAYLWKILYHHFINLWTYTTAFVRKNIVDGLGGGGWEGFHSCNSSFSSQVKFLQCAWELLLLLQGSPHSIEAELLNVWKFHDMRKSITVWPGRIRILSLFVMG